MKTLAALLLFLTITGCARQQPQHQDPAALAQSDLGCASFHFLWGTHSDYQGDYQEALKAYEKALVCDPKADYIREKIPLLILKTGDVERAINWLLEAIKDFPEKNSYKLFLANIYIQEQQLELAIALYHQALLNDPANETIKTKLGLLYTNIKDYDTAEKIFQELLKADDGSYFTHLSFARMLKQRNSYESSFRQYEKALDLNWSKELAYELGYFYGDQGKHLDALRTFSTITSNDKFDERATLSKIQALLDLKDYQRAIAELYRLRKFSDDPARIDLILSKVLLQKGDKEKAREILRTLAGKDQAYEAKYLLGLIRYEEQAHGESLDILETIPPGSDQFLQALLLRTKILKEKGAEKQAILMLRELVEKNRRPPLAFILLASFYQDENEQQLAEDVLFDGIKAYPENHHLLFELALLLEQQKRYFEAIEIMEQVIALEPNHAEALNFVGYTWADHNMHLEKALDYIQRANELLPDNGFILDSLGWVYYRLGNYQEAVDYLLQAIELEPGDPHIYDHLADAYLAKGKKKKAAKYYQKAVEMFEDQEKKRKTKEKLDKLGYNLP